MTGKYYLETSGNKFKFSKGMAGLLPTMLQTSQLLQDQSDFDRHQYVSDETSSDFFSSNEDQIYWKVQQTWTMKCPRTFLKTQFEK